MRLLVIGGTWFLGRALVEDALARDHSVTTFNRGRSGLPDVPGAEVVRGDRTDPADLASLATRGPWDAVIDPSGLVPADVLASARALADQTPRYAFVSTVNVYTGWPVDPLHEGSPVRDCPMDAPDMPLGPDETYGERYGRYKAGCERAAEHVFGDTALVARPGVILGPYEYIGRLPWWLRRMERGGRVLAPGYPERQIQPIDVRDVAAFIVTAVAESVGGTYNLAAPFGHATYGEFLTACREATGSTAELVWVADDFLTAHGVAMWTELPLWRTFQGTWRVDASRAIKAGLSCRQIHETAADTWAWLAAGGTVVESRRAGEIGIDPDKEARLLAAWDTDPRRPVRVRRGR